MSETIASAINSTFAAMTNCNNSGNDIWLDRWEQRLDQLRESLPSGSGFDQGTRILDYDEWPKRLQDKRARDSYVLLEANFHHMDDNGYYCGWSEHIVTARATFQGLDIDVSGRDVRGIKDFIAEIFHYALTREAPEAEFRQNLNATG